MENRNFVKTEQNESSLADMLETVDLLKISNEWESLCLTASMFQTLADSEREKVLQNEFSRETFEKLAASTYDLFAPYAFGDTVPKKILHVYYKIRCFSENEYIQMYKNGVFQFRTAIAAALTEMIDKRIEPSDKVKGLVFHMKETQTVVAPGYYSYNFETFLYNYIGKDLP